MTDNKYQVLNQPPPALYFNNKERDFVKQINDELLERVLPTEIAYFAISAELTNYHPLYGEALQKNFLPPIVVHGLVEWQANPTKTTNYGTDNTVDIIVHFQKRRLTDDQNLYVRVGDYVSYGGNYYEIVSLMDPKLLFGQQYQKFEITCVAKKARQDLFDAS